VDRPSEPPEEPVGPEGSASEPRESASEEASSPAPPPPVPPPPAAIPARQPPQAPRPTLVAGIVVGLGAAVIGVILVFVTIMSAMGSLYGQSIWVAIAAYFWPFIVLTVVGVLLMISRRWRRFGTGFLIIMAATAIVVLGPCIPMLVGP